MLVLMTTDAVGGVWDYSVRPAEALPEYGVQIAPATLGPAPNPRQREELQRLRPDVIPLHSDTHAAQQEARTYPLRHRAERSYRCWGNLLRRKLESLSAEQARQIGARARRRVLAEHTYAQRARQVEQCLLTDDNPREGSHNG